MTLARTMNSICKIMILLSVALTSMSLYAQEDSVSDSTSCVPVRTVSYDDMAFGPGEKMSFVMHYRWGVINSDVGTATAQLDTVTFNGIKAFKCSAYGRTTKLYDLFFKVREDFQSWFSCDGLVPLKFTRDTHEGNYEAKNTYVYDWSASDPHIVADIYTSSMGQKSMDIPLTKCTFDLPALFYFSRNMDVDNIEVGKKYPMTFAIDDEVFNVYFILQGRETIKVKGFGTVKTIRFAAKLLAGEVFKGEEDMTIWISDDQNRLPVYFEAPLIVGKASGRMTACEGLRYPFTALIEDKRK